jgi:hypothetical protein
VISDAAGLASLAPALQQHLDQAKSGEENSVGAWPAATGDGSDGPRGRQAVESYRCVVVW